MLKRQKIILAMLAEAGGRLRRLQLVTLAFLLSREPGFAGASTFYDFVPYQSGPFSFALYHELNALAGRGLLSLDQERLALRSPTKDEPCGWADALPVDDRTLASSVVRRFGRMPTGDLLRHVYEAHRWFAVKTERPDWLRGRGPKAPVAALAVYTVGYEGRSVDAFFDHLLRRGIRAIADVRANPVSRKYGLARSSMSRIAKDLGIEYEHLPALGIPPAARKGLDQTVSREQVFESYVRDVLGRRREEIGHLAGLVAKRPTALVCVEADPAMCHRSRLADRVGEAAGLRVEHL